MTILEIHLRKLVGHPDDGEALGEPDTEATS